MGKSVNQISIGLQFNPVDFSGIEAQAFAVIDPKISPELGVTRVENSPLLRCEDRIGDF
jgi:hypothetical protein